MNRVFINRRTFLKAVGTSAAALAVTGRLATGQTTKPAQTTIPRWRGFNLLDYFSPRAWRGQDKTTEDDLRWMSDWGFDFVRLPMAYPRWIDFDPAQRITPDDMYKIDESAVEYIDGLVEMAHKHGLHVSLNLHRAPGFCVNAGFHEPYNLWKDQKALDAFCFHLEHVGRAIQRHPSLQDQLRSGQRAVHARGHERSTLQARRRPRRCLSTRGQSGSRGDSPGQPRTI